MIGPILRLRVVGLICPCLEKEEDQAARSALAAVSSLPVRYHRKTKSEGGGGGVVSSASSAISEMFGGGGDSGGSSSSTTSFVKERATLTVMDTLSGPAVFVETDPEAGDAGDGEVNEDGDVIPVEPVRHRRTVPLRRVGAVAAAEGGFLGMGGGSSLVVISGAGGKGSKAGGEELLRFDVLGSDGKKERSADRRDEIVSRLVTLVEWDRRRREASGSAQGEDDTDQGDDEEEEFENDEDTVGRKKGGVPKGRAAKAAYFAKREIELTQKRREREKRKARYLKESGGLKYTAIAMANKEIT